MGTAPARGARLRTRPATWGDGPRCAEIFLVGRRLASPWQPPDRFRLDDYYDCVEDDEVVVAEIGGRVVGFASVDPRRRALHALFIDPAWRGRGIGSVLLSEALSRLPAPAELTCAVRNAAARAFYERHGWVAVPAASGPADPHVVYRKAGGSAA
ncbi:N-acetyltransferase family protein [Azospirillum sp. ST 5-10]|uniref:GNAT family N-acetyltransferase n=1 Tax=unclassified Azospirillum TaxID=2630922 RepID=UPI003F49EFDE